MINLKQFLTDDNVPLLLLFSLIISILVVAAVKLPQTPSVNVANVANVLGETAESENCQINQCGFCKNCGTENLSCGQLSRCVKQADRFACRFDLNCF